MGKDQGLVLGKGVSPQVFESGAESNIVVGVLLQFLIDSDPHGAFIDSDLLVLDGRIDVNSLGDRGFVKRL